MEKSDNTPTPANMVNACGKTPNKKRPSESILGLSLSFLGSEANSREGNGSEDDEPQVDDVFFSHQDRSEQVPDHNLSKVFRGDSVSLAAFDEECD